MLLNKVSADYFYLTREEKFGKPLEQVEREATEEQWEEMKPVSKDIGDLLREKGGPFFLGDTSKWAVMLIRALDLLTSVQSRMRTSSL